MLVDIRRNLQKVAATAIIGLLVLAFASWGIGDYVSGLSQVRVASIDGKGITDQAFARARQLQEQRYRNQLGENYKPGMLDDPLIKVALVQELIDQQLQITDAIDSGYRISPKQLTRTITGIDVFQGEDGFNRQQYKDLLSRQGLSISGFEKDLAESMITDQVRMGLSDTAIVVPTELEQLLDLQGEQRDIKFLLLPRDSFIDQVDVDEELIENFYNEHNERFQTPELVAIEYLELVLDDFAAKITIDPEQLQRLYSEQEADFQLPEKRQASHLLVSLSADADEAAAEAALAKINGLKQQLDEGAVFAELAREHSDDLGSARNGGDLGLFGRGIMDPEFETAAFTQTLNQVGDPVRSAFGYHLIQVTKIEQARQQSLAEVEQQLSLRFQREEAESAFFTAIETLQDIAYEQPDSLQPAADNFDLPIQQSELFPRFGGTGITGVSEIIEQAFSDDVLLSGQNSSVVTIEDSRAVVLRVSEHQPPKSKPLAEVADSIRQILLEQATSDALEARGNSLVKSLNQGENIEEQLSALSIEWQTRQAVTRSQPGLPATMVTEIFQMPADDSERNFQGISLDNGDYVLFTVTRLHAEPLPPTDEEREQLQQNLSRLRGDIAFIGYLKNLRDQADIQIYPENLN